MSTLLEIKTAVANYFEVALTDLTANGQDLFLLAANQVRKTAELNHDFEFNRKLVTVSVNGATGGDLALAIDANSNVVEVKTVLEAGLLDDLGNLRPVDWTTTSESIERYRGESGGFVPRYPTDGWARSGLVSGSRFTFSGDKIYSWPRTTEGDAVTFSLKLEAYTFTSDWSATSYSASVLGGTGVTAVNTTYYPFGFYNSKPLFISLAPAGTPTALYFIWNSGTAWIINQLPGTLGSNYHSLTGTDDSPAGTYTPHGSYTGTAIVTASAVAEIWTKHGQQHIQWATIVQLNHLFKHFVYRQEGNLPPPEKLAAEGLQTLIDWDDYKFEQFRRHGR